MSQLISFFVIFVTLIFGLTPVCAKVKSVQALTLDGFPIAGPALRYAASFEKHEGIRIEIEQRPFQELYSEVMIRFVTGQGSTDVILIPSAWLPDFAPNLSPVPNLLIQSDLVSDIHPIYRDALMRWDDQLMALTIDGDMHMGVYRHDLFSDPRYHKAFKKLYSRNLKPPRTWSNYMKIMEFFHMQTDSKGRQLTDTLEAFSKGGQRLWYVLSHAAAYTNHPDFPGSMLFDPQSMKPAITNPGWHRALTEYLELSKSVPSDISSLDSYEVRSRFSRGEAAMAIDWTDIGVLAASK
jgi:multiple sugar transport system substrate-binding protein